MDTDELILALSRLADDVRAGIEYPNDMWVPLHAVLPEDHCSGFMFMGAVRAAIIPPTRSFISSSEADAPDPAWERRTIFLYKHGITRRYLNLGTNLRPYYYVGSTADFAESTYVGGADPARQLEHAIDCVFDGIEDFGATRTTSYDDEYIAARNARLAAIGVTVVSS